MLDVLTVDRLEVLVLIDNTTDSLSTNPPNVVAEWSGLPSGARLRVISGPTHWDHAGGLLAAVKAAADGRSWEPDPLYSPRFRCME